MEGCDNDIVSDKMIMVNSSKNSSFVKNLKDEIKKIFYVDDVSGNGIKGQGDFIKTITSNLRKGKSTGQEIKITKQIKAQESFILKQIGYENKLWIESFSEENYLDEGAEQKVYLSGSNVIKINNGQYYESWEDYLISIQLHNILFPNTTYTLLGFMEKNNDFYIVVQQPYIESTEKYLFEEIKILMEVNGFRNTRNQDFINDELGIIVEDLHDENVLKQKGIYFFIDTAIYITNKDKFEISTKQK
jgi:hypothetical protein